jgi:hypothetical protein
MDTHVKVLGILHIVFGAFGVLIGIGVLALFGGIVGFIQLDDGDEEAQAVAPILGAVGVLVLIVALALSVPGIIAGIGLLSFQPWARILTIILSALELMSVPFGTALGIYGLWVLLTADGARLFQQRAVGAAPVQNPR